MSRGASAAVASISIVTACLPAAAEHLHVAARSVHRLREELAERRIEWVLVLDGPGDVDIPATTDRVVRLPTRRGVAAARNYALSVVSSELTVCLDADDQIEPAGAAAAAAVLETDPTLGWVAANRLLVTGEKTFHWHGARAWPPGSVAAEWSAPMAFHANTLMVRTALVRRVGGWPALGACEDLLLALRLGEESPGASIEEVLILYRAWEGQTTRAPGFREEQALAYDFIEQSVNAGRAYRGRAPVRHPEPLGGQGSVAVDHEG